MGAVCDHEWAEFRRLDKLAQSQNCSAEEVLAAYDRCEYKYLAHLTLCVQNNEITQGQFDVVRNVGVECRKAYVEWLITCYT